MAKRVVTPLTRVGWREWLTLPEIGIPYLRAKVDTGARTSALHAIRIKYREVDGLEWVDFDVHPFRAKPIVTVHCSCPLLDMRDIKSSNGKTESRPVILTPLTVAGMTYDIEVTLTNRSQMGFPMLLGREALAKRFLVDVSKSFLLGKPPWIKSVRKKQGKKAARKKAL